LASFFIWDNFGERWTGLTTASLGRLFKLRGDREKLVENFWLIIRPRSVSFAVLVSAGEGRGQRLGKQA